METFQNPYDTKKLMADIWQRKVQAEVNLAKDYFAPVIELVKTRYEAPESTIAGNKDQAEAYQKHNEEILWHVTDLAMKKGFAATNEKDFRLLQLAAMLHDMTKADSAPQELADIKPYVLVAHGEDAAREILEPGSEIVSEDVLKKIGVYSIGEIQEAREKIARAIECHMGPAAFMKKYLGGVNKELKERGIGRDIQHPYPEDKIGKILLAADMKALAGTGGMQKVLALRAGDESFQNTDDEACEEYRKAGIELSRPEAALISAYQSALDAIEMIQDEFDKSWAAEAPEQAKKQKEFVYRKTDGSQETLDLEDVISKFEKYRKIKQEK